MRNLVNILLCLTPSIAAGQYIAHVSKITDGDTLSVEASTGTIKIRLFGVDSPEKNQEGGDAATRFTAATAFDRTVQVVEYYTDRYGRTVADIVLPNGRTLSQELVTAGHAWWYQRYAPGDVELQQLEDRAHAERRGLWAGSNPVALGMAQVAFTHAGRGSTAAGEPVKPPEPPVILVM